MKLALTLKVAVLTLVPFFAAACHDESGVHSGYGSGGNQYSGSVNSGGNQHSGSVNSGGNQHSGNVNSGGNQYN